MNDVKVRTDIGTAFIELTVLGNLELVSSLREGIVSVLRGIGASEELLGRLEVAVHEMLENAIKGSVDKRARVRVEVYQQTAEVHTWNRANSFDLRVLERSLTGFDSLENADAQYMKVMKEAALRATGSGLGLQRIRAEAEMTVAHDIDGTLLHVVAKTAVKPKAAGARP